MSKINSFLQKIKLHESHHGVYMVITAYVLSILLLILGSDVFYGIVSKAENVNNESDEVTQIIQREKIINPYGLTEDLKSTLPMNSKLQEYTADTNWLLGFAMDSEEYNNLLEQMDKLGAMQAVELGADPVVQPQTIESLGMVDGNKIRLSVTREEVKMLEQIVEAEASGEDMKGKILIVNVILNRLTDEEFPDSIKEVIFQKAGGEYQFSPVKDERYWEVKVSEKTREAVKRALEGEDYSEGALYFMARKRTKSSNAKWFDNNLDWLFKHGGHDFYKHK